MDGQRMNLNSNFTAMIAQDQAFNCNEENRFSFAPTASFPVENSNGTKLSTPCHEEAGLVQSRQRVNRVCANTVTFNLNIQDEPTQNRPTFAPSPAVTGRGSTK